VRLADIPLRLVEDTVRKWRRRAIAIGMIAVCALAALVEGLAALRLALEAMLGPVWARIILAGIFLAVVAATALGLGYLERRDVGRRERQARASGPFAKDERVSMIAEAIDLGYSLARDLKQPGRPGRTDPDAAPAAAEDAPVRPGNGARPERRPASR
jgi:type VI protein secretion system component VasK